MMHNMKEWTLNSCFVYVAYIDVFSPHSNDMTSRESSSAEKISCNMAPFFYHQCVETISCIRQAKENVYNVR
jgi:hypothetical protein